MSPAVQRETDILNAITQILTLIAPHLDILSLFLTFPRRSFLIDVRLPRLEELSLYGPFPDAGVDDDQCYVPSLHRVHFGAVPAPVGADGGPDYVEEAIRRAPKLTHIRLSLFGNLVRAPLAMISTIERLMSKDKEKENSTSMLEEILYQPGVATWCSGCGTSWPNHDPIVKRMRQLALTTTGFSVLFPRLSGETGCIYDDEDSMRDWELAQLAWSNRMQRGDWRR